MSKIFIRGREDPIETWVCGKAIEMHGVENIKLNLTGNNGWPDRLFWIPGGRPLLIEFKRPDEEPEPLQAHRHQKLRDWGYDIEVHDDRDQALEAIRRAVEAAPVSGKRAGASGRKRRAVPVRFPRRG